MGESPYEFIRTGETSFAPLRNRPVRGRDTFTVFIPIMICISFVVA
ncbi:hypothetical protein M5E82_19120 [Parabacteroides distasonis]|nr:hypothetical protein M5E82_19120 [Parabacteroides distasonis]